jgi:nuclear pore complex protein Nup98-Nup96
LALLSGNKMKEACDKAQNAHDHYAVMLASQSSGNNCFVGQLTLQQLDRWQEAKADKFIDNNRLSLFAHVAGVPVWPGSETALNTCEDLDWLRCLGQHLWYFTSPSASIADALSAYEEAFTEGDTQFGVYAAPPTPSYANSEEDVFDVKFQLMKLYANRTYPLERIVTPVTHTPDHLDHRLGWLVAQVLRSLGYRHLSEEKRDRHHAEFASQLESLGMWHWSVFVLLHLSDATQRRACVKDVLGRHVKLGDPESNDREVFLQDQLDIPSAWIAEAKAMSAATAGDYGDQVNLLKMS